MSEEITDSQWALIAPLLPVQRPLGRRRADDRQTLNGILWMLRTGARWHDLPQAYGSDTRCHRRLKEWQAQGVWEQIWRAFSLINPAPLPLERVCNLSLAVTSISFSEVLFAIAQYLHGLAAPLGFSFSSLVMPEHPITSLSLIVAGQGRISSSAR